MPQPLLRHFRKPDLPPQVRVVGRIDQTLITIVPPSGYAEEMKAAAEAAAAATAAAAAAAEAGAPAEGGAPGAAPGAAPAAGAAAPAADKKPAEKK